MFAHHFLIRFLIIFLINPFSASPQLTSSSSRDPDFGLTTVELIESRGFIAESHYPITSDGYILGLFRIRNPFCQRSQASRRPPALLWSSFLSSSDQWLFNGGSSQATPLRELSSVRRGDVLSNNLGFELSNHGFDVWLANERGSFYSTNHTTLSTSSVEFWKYSLNEIILEDLPTVTKYILRVTKSAKLAFIGHSDGALVAMGLMAARPRYATFFDPVILLAPACRYTNANFFMRLASSVGAEVFRDSPGPFLMKSKLASGVIYDYCAPPAPPLCTSLIASFFDSKQINHTRIPVYLSYVPAGSSTWALAHQFMLTNYDRFVYFDYGPLGNYRNYNNYSVPSFNLTRITNRRICFIYSRDDQQSDFEDVMWTRDQLSVPLFVDYLLPIKDWDHFDFMWAKDLGRLVVPQVLRILNRVQRLNAGLRTSSSSNLNSVL